MRLMLEAHLHFVLSFWPSILDVRGILRSILLTSTSNARLGDRKLATRRRNLIKP